MCVCRRVGVCSVAAPACCADCAAPLFTLQRRGGALLNPQQVVEVHGDFDASIGLDHEEAYRSVVCLRRKEA